MRLKQLLLIVPASAIVAGCSQADAATPDPANDVHCSVVAFYYNGLANHARAPADQRRATAAIHEWYAARLRATVARESWDEPRFQEEVTPVLNRVKADPVGNSPALVACTDRAAADPEFERFVDSLPSRPRETVALRPSR